MTQTLQPVPDGTAVRALWSPVTVPLPPALREAVERAAAATDRSMASVVRQAVREYVNLAEEPNQPVRADVDRSLTNAIHAAVCEYVKLGDGRGIA